MSANLLHYLKNEAETEIPIWQMISTSMDSLQQRAENWRNYLGFGEVQTGFSTVGGGSLPTEEMATFLFNPDPTKT